METSRPQGCGATDMLHFLFSFCSTRGDATNVKPKREQMVVAFDTVQCLANSMGSHFRDNLNSGWVGSTAAHSHVF